MESYNSQLSKIGRSAKGYLSVLTGQREEFTADDRKEGQGRVADARAGALVLILALILSFVMLWSVVALIGNSSTMSESATFLATLLLFLTPIFPFAPIFTLLIVYRTRVPIHAMVSAAQEHMSSVGSCR